MQSRAVVPEQFQTFGALLRYLRERAELTQRELALQVGYHYSYLSRVERGERFPDQATVLARFVPALFLEDQPEWANRLVKLAAAVPGGEKIPLPAGRATPPPASPTIQGTPQPIPGGRARVPIPLTPFLGREAEVERLVALLSSPDVRLLTLTGPPGIGKTRLSLRLAGELEDAYPGGITFIDLTTVRDPQLLAAHLVQSLGLNESGSGAPEAVLVEALKSVPQFLILDNFEQIIPAAPLVSRLLQAAQGLKILVTSREILRLQGEYEFPVPSLPAQDVDTAPAIRLFAERARAVQPDFELTAENGPVIAELCTHLDGLPLAIELAAARINLFSPAAMLARLDRRLGWLTGGKQDGPDWRRTLQGAIDWSYQLLDEAGKSFFASLAVFAGGGTLSAVEAVCGGDLDSLAVLGEKSLIVLHPAVGTDSEPRFTWLESLKEFALGILVGTPERHRDLRAAHAAYYRGLAESSQGELSRSRAADRLKLLDTESDNLREAILWALETGAGELAVRFCVALADYWDIRGRYGEARRLLKAALEIGGDLPPALLGRAYSNAGWLAVKQSDLPEAISFYEKSVEAWRKLGDETSRANTLVNIGALLSHQNLPGMDLKVYFLEALEIYRSESNQRGAINALNHLGIAAYGEGDFQLAFDSFREVYERHQEIGDAVTISGSMNNLGLTSYALGHYQAARDWHIQSLSIRERLGIEGRIGQSRVNLAFAMLRTGDLEQAGSLARAALLDGMKLDMKMGVVEALEAVATLASLNQEVSLASRLFAAAAAERERIGSSRDAIQRLDHDWALSLLGEAVGTAEWEQDWAAGRRLNLEEAVRMALESG